MSITLDYFFNYDGDLPTLAKLIDGTLGCTLKPYEGDPEDLFCRFLSLELTLCTHNLEDDRDCDFTRFRYELGTRTPLGDADIRGVQTGFMAILPYLLFQRAGIGEGILVYDIQRILDRYRTYENALIDELSHDVVEPAKNVPEVYRRIAGC